jgi:DNA-binding GntR family transcriptional regulator
MQSDIKGAAAAAQPLQEKVYNLIKEKIVNCEMLPGAVICEDVLVERFGTSRTPIREALLRLQRERLVDIFPRQGTFVSQICLKDIYEIYQLRLIIEPQVVKISCKNLDPAVLRRFRDFFDGLDAQKCSYAEWFRQDRELHSYIVDSSGNSHLRQMYGSIMDQNLRMRILAGKIPSRMRETNHEHLAILDALLARDEQKAEEVMVSHILSSRNAALQLENFRQEPVKCPAAGREGRKADK